MAVSTGKTDGLVDDIFPIVYMIRYRQISNLKIATAVEKALQPQGLAALPASSPCSFTPGSRCTSSSRTSSAWLPDMTLIDLRLGRRRFDIRFWRDGKETLFEVLRGKHSAVERKAASALRK
jgi:hypothetical protein